MIYPQKDSNHSKGNLANGCLTSSATSNAYNINTNINTNLNSTYFKEQEARTTIYDANGNLSYRNSNNGGKNLRIESSNDPTVVDRCMPFSMFRSFFSSPEVGNSKNKNIMKTTNGNGNGNGNGNLNCVSSSHLQSTNKESDNIDGNNITDENGEFHPNESEYLPRSYLTLGNPRRITDNVSPFVKYFFSSICFIFYFLSFTSSSIIIRLI